MTVEKRLCALRRKMEQRDIGAVIITSEDYHGSEYVGEYFKIREYFSGFDGSAGTLVVTLASAALWTDGRYFLQAAQQLDGSGIVLMRDGEKDVAKIEDWTANELLRQDGLCCAADGRTLSVSAARRLEARLAKDGITLRLDEDIAGAVWSERPEKSANSVWALPENAAGESRKEKFSQLRNEMEKFGADIFALSALDEIAWLLNLRGSDVEYNPVFLSYMLIERESARLFAQKNAFPEEIEAALKADGVILEAYDNFYNALSDIKDKCVLIDPERSNSLMSRSLSKLAVVEKQSPLVLMKARKNAAEQDGFRRAHIKDGAAVTRFIYWLKHNVGKRRITELSAAKKLVEFRREQDGYLGESFEPIIAYGAHGAIVHYSSTEESNVQLMQKGLVLCDTGGHYLDATTDITRTIALGTLTDEEKKCFTLVLAGHLELGAAVFPRGACGADIDAIARAALWREGLDYNHGTGHGVGHILNVHEAPQRISWRSGRKSAPFDEGMITSNEPGVYVEGRFGVRHENLVLCREAFKTPFGEFLCFDTLTLVPFDLDGIDARYLSKRQIDLLNAYHARVYKEISPLLPSEEAEWLKMATRKI